jgi:lactoylglutathione lyase
MIWRYAIRLHIDHVHAVATDMDRSIAFYTDILGFDLLRRLEFGPPDARRQLAYVGTDNMVIELVPPADPSNPLGGTGARPLAMTVDDMDSVLRELESKGVAVAGAARPGFSFQGRTAVVQDPSGVAIELREWQENGYSAGWAPEREDVVNIT